MGRRAKPSKENCPYVTKGGLKLAFAIDHFQIDLKNFICADLGSHQGGFVDCLLKYGAKKVYSVDTCYGVLDWSIRNNPQVIVCERANALHWYAPEKLDLVSIDVGWTRQEYIIPAAMKNLKDTGVVLSLLKPQYEVKFEKTSHGVVSKEQLQKIMDEKREWLQDKFKEVASVLSPYPGSGGNIEAVFLLRNPIR